MGHKLLIYSRLCSLHDALNSCRCCEGHYTSPRSQQGHPAGHVSFVGSREVNGSGRNLFVYLLSEALWTLEGKLTQAGKVSLVGENMSVWKWAIMVLDIPEWER